MTVAWKRMEDADLDLCLSPKMCVLCEVTRLSMCFNFPLWKMGNILVSTVLLSNGPVP